MLIDADLPDNLWGEAAQTIVYLRNRCVSSVTPKATPYEMFFGSKPDVSNLRIYGCLCFGFIPKEARKDNKLGPRAIRSKLVGYGEFEGQKGWRLYDLEK